MIEKIRALLAKAESTEFEAEANALMAKAFDLMVKHGIAEGDLTEKPNDTLERRTITIDAPYSSAKVQLFASVAKANNCFVVQSSDSRAKQRILYVFGYASDLSNVEVLYTSLLVQAMRQLGKARAQMPHVQSKTFTNSYLLGYAHRISQLLTKVERAAYEAEPSLLPVARSKAVDVADRVAADFPRLRTAQATSRAHGGAVEAGRSAAGNADIYARTGSGVRGALNA